MKKFLLLTAFLLNAVGAFAQKEVYLPMEWRGNSSTYKESDPDNSAQYSKSRSQLLPTTEMGSGGIYSSMPVEVMVGGATCFVLNIERMEKA